jgi:hypothetical protein
MKYIMLISIVLILVSCSKETLDEAFKSKHSKNKILYIHYDKDKKGAVVFYQNQFPNGTGIGTAIFEGNAQKGWQYLSATAQYNEGFILSSVRISYLEDSSMRLFFGVVDDLEIEKIVIEDKNGEQISANLIQTEWKRIWFAFVAVNGELILHAYDKEGKVLYKVPDKA